MFSAVRRVPFAAVGRFLSTEASDVAKKVKVPKAPKEPKAPKVPKAPKEPKADAPVNLSDVKVVDKRLLARLLVAEPAHSYLTKEQVANLLDSTFEKILSLTMNNDTRKTVKIAGFGSFSHKLKAARSGRNPRTGEALEISEKHLLHFKDGSKKDN